MKLFHTSWWLFITCSTALMSQPAKAANRNAEQPEHSRSGNINSNQRGTNDAPFAVRIIKDDNQSSAGEARASRAEKREDEQLDAQRAATSASWLQTIFGFLSVALLVWTLWYTRKSAVAAMQAVNHAKDALEHTVIAANAAGRSADAAERAVDLSTQQFAISRRPYLSIHPVSGRATNSIVERPDGSIDHGNFLVVFGRVENQGQSPATQVRIAISAAMSNHGEDPQWNTPDWIGAGETILAPKQTGSSDPMLISRSDFERAFRREKDIHIRIIVHYKSAESDTDHVTMSIVEVNPRGTFDSLISGNDDAVALMAQPGSMMS